MRTLISLSLLMICSGEQPFLTICSPLLSFSTNTITGLLFGGQVSQIDNKYWAYPVLTAPLASKGINDAVCPKSHLEVAREFVSSCNKFLIIGTSGLDQDLLALIDSAVSSPMPDYLIHIVDVNQGADEASNRFKQGIRAFGDNVSKVDTFGIGFRGYLKSQHLQSFVKFGAY